MRVLHLVYSLQPGGMENGVVNLVNNLGAGSGCELHVACLRAAGRFGGRLGDPGRLHALGGPERLSGRPVLALRRLVDRLRPDLVHSHNLGPLIYACAARAAGRRFTLLHGEHAELPPSETAPIRLVRRAAFYLACSAIHTVSDGQVRQLRALHLATCPLLALPNGVDAERFHPARGSGRPGTSGAPVIGVVARFGAYKRQAELVEAFGRLGAAPPPGWSAPPALVLAGSGGPREGEVRALAAASPAADRIHFLGYLGGDAVAAAYRGFDLVVVPSLVEGLSNVVLEAMASGLPVLSHRSCGASEVITPGRDGLVADLSTPGKIAHELASALGRGPQALRRIGARARRTVEGRWSLRQMAGRYREIYHALAEG